MHLAHKEQHTEQAEKPEFTKDFVLDYELTKKRTRRLYREAVHHGVFDDAYHDTYADYLEQRHTIPVKLGHLQWFRYKMWNRVNEYEPFRQRVKAQNGGYDEVLFSGECISELEIQEDSSTQDPEHILMCEQELRQEMRIRYPVHKNEAPVTKFLRMGYSMAEAADLAGCSHQNAQQVYAKGLRRSNEHRASLEQDTKDAGR
jgi:hypothetical protein